MSIGTELGQLYEHGQINTIFCSRLPLITLRIFQLVLRCAFIDKEIKLGKTSMIS